MQLGKCWRKHIAHPQHERQLRARAYKLLFPYFDLGIAAGSRRIHGGNNLRDMELNDAPPAFA